MRNCSTLLTMLLMLAGVGIKAQNIEWEHVSLNDRWVFSPVKTFAVDPASATIFADQGRSGLQRSSDNGRSWEHIYDIKNKAKNISSVADLVINAHTNTILASDHQVGIVRSKDNGNSWHPALVSDPPGGVGSLFVTSDDLILAAAVDEEGESLAVRYSRDDGNTWAMASMPANLNFQMAAFAENGPQQSLFVFGSTGKMLRSDNAGADWQQVGYGFPPTALIGGVVTLPNGDMLAAAGELFRSADNGATWQPVDHNLNFSPLFNSLTLSANGSLIASMTGSNGGVYLSPDVGSSWRRISHDSQIPNEVIYRVSVEADGHIYVGHSFGLYRSVEALEEPHGMGHSLLQGTMAFDRNENCGLDDEDVRLGQRVVELQPGPVYLFSDESGSFEYRAQPGEYKLRSVPQAFWRYVCAGETPEYELTVDADGQILAGNDFLLLPTAAIKALRLSIATGPARPGMHVNYRITYENVGTLPFDGTIVLRYDPVLEFLNAKPRIQRLTRTTAEWDIRDFPVGARASIRVQGTLPITTPLGYNLCAAVRHISRDIDLLSDTDYGFEDRVCLPVTSAVDPNDLQVVPAGDGHEGWIVREDSVLNYLIRFQNSGNDTAFNVRIVNELSEHLDLNSLRLGAASHDYSATFESGGQLAFSFNSILLPDSTTNEAASHGFVKYSLKLKPGLPAGTVIRNRAAIYFDFNAPVFTNEVRNTMSSPTDVAEQTPADISAIEVFPNPTGDLLTVRLAGVEPARLSLYTMLGRRCLHSEGRGPAMKLDLAHLPAGLYLLRVSIPDAEEQRIVRILR